MGRKVIGLPLMTQEGSSSTRTQGPKKSGVWRYGGRKSRRRANARSVSFRIPGQFTWSTPLIKPNYLVSPEGLEERGGVGMPNRPIFQCSNVSKNISVAFDISPLLPIYDFCLWTYKWICSILRAMRVVLLFPNSLTHLDRKVHPHPLFIIYLGPVDANC